MKRLFHLIIASVLLGSLTIQPIAEADPIMTFCWDDSTTYENGQLIPGGDLVNRQIHCGLIQGGPYPFNKPFEMQVCPSIEDLQAAMQGPGTYWCASTVDSLAWGSTSGYSNEINFTVTAPQLGYRPNPMTLREGNL